jgi:hypothetical protein
MVLAPCAAAAGSALAFLLHEAFYTPRQLIRKGFMRWQVLGILDLVMAVTLATMARLHGMDMGAMTVLPLSLVPSFIVPLLMMLHILLYRPGQAGARTKVRAC